MLLDSAFPANASIPCAALAFHRQLAAWNRSRASTVFDAPDWLTSLQAQYRMRRLETEFVSAASASVRRFAREAPSDRERFSAWFAQLEHLRPSTTAALFDRLANQVSPAQLRWYLEQSAVAESAFAELSALTQYKLAPAAPDDTATNYAANAGDPLVCLGRALAFAHREDTTWEALAVSNLMVAFAANRRYAHHSAGALAAIELTAPSQLAAIESGLRRTGVANDLLQFDRGAPGWSWCNDVLPALVAQDPSAASQIAEGALSRLAAGARYFERCNRELDTLREPHDAVCPAMMLPVGTASDAEVSYAN